MADEELKKEQEVEITEEVVQDETVEVDTSVKNEEIKKEPESVSREEFLKAQKRNEYLNRQLKKSMDEISNLAKELKTSRESQGSAGDDTDDLDRIAEKDWKQAVKLLGKEAAKEYYTELRQQQEILQKQQQTQSALENSKSKVLQKYPNIEDETSNEAMTYMQVLNEDPSLLGNPNGPEIAMYRMEERLRASGHQPASYQADVRNSAEAEVQRRLRTQATSGMPSRATTGTGRVTLTQQEAEMAKNAGIPLSEYAKMKAQGERGFKEGVTVDE